MAAYNWIEFECHCATCARKTTAKAQVHLVSSFDGDESGRFCHRTYRVGESMVWFEPTDRRFDTWKDEQDDFVTGNAHEVCYAECLSCGAEFNVVIALRNFAVESVTLTDQPVP